jgi:uncharacterized protein (TIGR03066 family)
MLLSLACIAGAAVATVAGFEVFFPVRLPTAMRGKWVVVEGKDLQGATLEFFADGRMIGTVRSQGKEVAIKGRVAIDGNTFRVTTSGRTGDLEVTDVEEILDLTERRFVVQDPHGEILIMERVNSPAMPAKGGVR